MEERADEAEFPIDTKCLHPKEKRDPRIISAVRLFGMVGGTRAILEDELVEAYRKLSRLESASDEAIARKAVRSLYRSWNSLAGRLKIGGHAAGLESCTVTEPHRVCIVPINTRSKLLWVEYNIATQLYPDADIFVRSPEGGSRVFFERARHGQHFLFCQR
jgi:hypothetical protein